VALPDPWLPAACDATLGRMTDPVLVLGASGFIGDHMLNGLARQGVPVIAGMRRPRKVPDGIEVRQVDALDAASVAAALAGVSAVVNCIAVAPEEMTKATQVLAQAAGHRRIVHLSTMSVYGGVTGLVTEDTPLRPEGAYGEGKAECENILRAHATQGGSVVMLRPGCVHGPGSESWTARPARLLRAGRLGDLGPAGDGICNLTSVADLVSAAAAALRLQEGNGQAFNVSDPEPGEWNTYFLNLGRAIGATPVKRLSGRRLKVEKLAAFPLKAMEIVGRKAKMRMPDPMPPSLLRLFQQDIVLDHRQADAGLGFRRTPPAEALAEAAAWAKAA
jgi:nucleoside-diphosphate-sugar epimerase